MTQITLAHLLLWAWHSGHTPAPRLPVSTVPTPHRQHVPAGPAAGAGLAVPPRLGDTPRSVQLAGAALPAGGRHHQAGQPHVSADVPVQTDGCEDQLGALPSGPVVSSDPWLGWLTLAG